MNTSPRKLPSGIQDFEKLRRAGYIYVDKTKYLYELVKEEKPFFLSRPRRFGKSLFISALKAFFLGKRELFDGLAIADLEHDWIEYPVIYIDFNRGSSDSLQAVKNVLNAMLEKNENEWGIVEKSDDLSVRFSNLIETANEKSGKKVVVLVDEYDKALVNTIDKSLVNEELLAFFKGFYGVLKGMDYCLRYVFLTGVTKFARVSIFSDLNQLIDISLDEQYAEICGISETELLHYFKPEIEILAQKRKLDYDSTFAELKKRYDGYRFAKESDYMYNPFSLLNTFEKKDFGYYWFKTGTPTFLTKGLLNNEFEIEKLNDDVTIAVSEIDEYRADDTSLVPLLYQSGYLTIKSYDIEEDEFILGFPNEEVKYGFLKELLPAFVPQLRLKEAFSTSRFTKNLNKGNIEEFMTQLIAFFASIPYDAIKKKHQDEKYFQHIFYLLFTLMGQSVKSEVKSAKGRADAVVKTANSIYVFEFKMDKKGTAEDALKQIDDKGYLIPYTADERRLVKIGVEFSIEEKGIKRWVMNEQITINNE